MEKMASVYLMSRSASDGSTEENGEAQEGPAAQEAACHWEGAEDLQYCGRGSNGRSGKLGFSGIEKSRASDRTTKKYAIPDNGVFLADSTW